jgi:predicted phosphoribosyltransferase
MATVRELSAPYENFLLGPQRGPGVCTRCFNLTDGYQHCYACTRQDVVLDAVAPISYSVAHEQLHHALAAYKRCTGPAARRLAVQLAAVLWRYLDAHEQCLAQTAGVPAFPVVTTVPSGAVARDGEHPLRWMVGEAIGVTRGRYAPLLRRSSCEVVPRSFSSDRYVAETTLAGEPVLLIDDTWTSGASAQSAAAALKAAGASIVAAVVIGRHVNREWHENDRRLRALAPFDWRRCVLCGPAAVAAAAKAGARRG